MVNQFYKLRNIVNRKSQNTEHKTMGITIPNNIAMFFENTYFSIEKSGTSIILTSGANIQITKEQIEAYKYENSNPF